MIVENTALPGVLLVKPKVFGDARGFFLESWSRDRYREMGMPEVFVQDNISRSRRDILRGLHVQNPNSQGKLVQALVGEVYDVAVDVRINSPTFGRAVGVHLTAENHYQLYIPPGFAHGFCVLSEDALFGYKCTEFYSPSDEFSILWNDPDLAIEWPINEPLLSEKDKNALRLKDIPEDRLPVYAV